MLHKSTEKRNAKAFILEIKLQVNFPAKALQNDKETEFRLARLEREVTKLKKKIVA